MKTRFEPYQATNVLCRREKENADSPETYLLNPYRGCSVGCRYCYIQEKKHEISTGLEEEKQKIVQLKINAPCMLEGKLEEGVDYGVIIIGESCEPYDVIEKKFLITNRLLEIIQRYGFPVHIVTRFPLIMRDIELIRKIKESAEAYVTVSLPVVSKELVEKLDGNSPTVKERLKLIKRIRKAGVSAGVALSPFLPFISDGYETERVLKKASSSGASYALFSPLIIKEYQKKMFYDWLEEKYPEKAQPYKDLYDNREKPEENYVNDLYQRFRKNARKYKLEPGVFPDVPLDRKIKRKVCGNGK